MSLRETHAIFVGGLLLCCIVWSMALFARFDAAAPWFVQLLPIVTVWGLGAAALVSGLYFWDSTRKKP